jgi:hypothetical protein
MYACLPKCFTSEITLCYLIISGIWVGRDVHTESDELNFYANRPFVSFVTPV